MIRLPEKILVGHLVYTVRPMTADEADESGAEGICSQRRETIRVSTAQCDRLMLETLLHEVGHAINWLAAIDDSASEEDYVLRTTPIWMTVWRDNPDLLDLLLDYVDT